jgi:hypothetical protein
MAPFQAHTVAKSIAQSRHKDHPRQNRAMYMLNKKARQAARAVIVPARSGQGVSEEC